MSVLSKTLTCSCYELGHTWEPSCLKSVAEIAYSGYTESFKIYAPLYIIAALLRKKKKDYYLKRLLPEILQSTLFLGTNAACFIGSFCVWRKLAGFYFFFNVFVCGIPACALGITLERADRIVFGKFNFLNSTFIPAATASFIAILLERKQRRGMLALYMFNLACETSFRMAASRGYVKPIKNGEVLLFSLTTAVLMYLYRVEGGLKESMQSAVRFLVGGSEEGGAYSNVPQKKKLIDSQLFQAHPAIKKLITRSRQLPRHPLCKHQHSCVHSTLHQSIKLFTRGYAIQCVVKLLGALPTLFKKPRNVLNALKHRDNFSFGFFLASFAGIYKAVSCLCRWVRDKDSQFHGLLAGFLAGWSMMFYKSSSIAMYLATKLAEVLYFKGIEGGFLPYMKVADIILYTLSTSLIFHTAVFECHNLRPAYWKFLLRLTNGRFAYMNRALLDIYNTQASKMFKDFDPKLNPRYSEIARQMLSSSS